LGAGLSMLKFWLIGVLLFFAPSALQADYSINPFNLKKKYKHTLAICAIFRDEAPYLKEWIEFHRAVGVEKFYLYNNCSTDDFTTVLLPYVKKGIVEVIKWNYDFTHYSEWSPIQVRAYTDCLNRLRARVKWLAFIDVDEFLFPVQKSDLRDVLKDYEEFGAVCVNWQMFGSSNVEKVPADKLLIELLLYKAPTDYSDNHHVKSIVRPEFVRNCKGPHNFRFGDRRYQVNTNKEQFFGITTTSVLIDKLRIHHYWTRDLDYLYRVKIGRREKWQENISGVIKRHEEINQVYDDAILRYVPAVRKRVFSSKIPD